MKNLVLFSVLSFLSLSGLAQNAQAEYLEAKRLFNQKQYSVAKVSFSTLIDNEVFGPYAGFYYGLSALNQGDTTVAGDMWRQLLLQHPTWKQKSELLFWLSYISFERKDYNKGMAYVEELTEQAVDSEIQSKLIGKYLDQLNIEQLEGLYENYNENRVLASILATKINAQPHGERDDLFLLKLMEKWDFELKEIQHVELPLVRKDRYDIGVFLPFLFESLENTAIVTQNSIVMDMYQGMELAAEDLKASGYPVNLYPYDTKKREEITRNILNKPEAKDLDLIVGPLYPGPNKAVNEFSKKNLINTINPLSSNGQVIADNSLSFLIKPSYETIARELAKLAIQESDSNRNVMIIYEENDRDSAFAAEYKKVLDSAGFNVLWYQAVNKENSKEVLESLSAQSDVFRTQEEADSIALISGRFIRQRRVRTDELEKMARHRRNEAIPEEDKYVLPINLDDNGNEIVFYEKVFDIAEDSIGHILGATRSNLYANNLISAVETRNDNIKLYGYGDWLDFTMISYNQLDRLDVALTQPDFIDQENYFYQDLKSRLTDKYKTIPSLNHYRGYELIWYVGTMMHRYGKYFQQGIRGSGYQKGRVFEGFRYEMSNDNQVVPIIRFNDALLEAVNKPNYEDREK